MTFSNFDTQIQIEEDKEFHAWLDSQDADDLQAIENEDYLSDIMLMAIPFDEPETFESLDDITAEQQQYDDQRDLDFYES
jgi:hypothetical protein